MKRKHIKRGKIKQSTPFFSLANENDLNFERIIDSYELRTRFDKRTLIDAQELNVSEQDKQFRQDFQNKTVFTIDGDDAKDFDDAVGIEKTANGYILYVHIADVSHFVKPNTRLDKEARLRGTSVYFPFGCIPMLPAKLSDDLCSLRPNETKLTLSVIMSLDNAGKLKNFQIVEGIINSASRLTYTQAQSIIDGNNDESLPLNVINDLKIMAELAKILIKKRSDCIDINSYECEFSFKGKKVDSVKRRQNLFSHRIIEEFMILTNEVVALSISKKMPFLYRIHDKVSPLKAQRLADFLFSRGIDFEYDDTPTVSQLKKVIENASPTLKNVLDMMILRTMAKAVYSTRNKGHFGLNLTHYCHFTSPIRRYPDLFIHRVIKAALKNENVKQFNNNLEELAEHCSLTERLADEAEREVDDFLKAQVLKQHIGESFLGTVSGVAEFGIFIRLENTAEGLIRIENLDGFYTFNKESLSLTGKNTYTLGDQLEITIFAIKGGKAEFILKQPHKFA